LTAAATSPGKIVSISHYIYLDFSFFVFFVYLILFDQSLFMHVSLTPSIIQVIKSRRARWAGHVTHMEEDRDAYRVLVGKSEGEGLFGRPRQRQGY
jgi:hypothetical protein